ncbi:MAG TPA: hypothetical protein VI934_00785 [Candidatus Nanoarchaeia archaeon]|nr:hypothetical protein [Candidatus Nanoarchaeia archaeon]
MVTVYRQLKAEFADERGGITRLLDDGKTALRSVLLITCKKGSIRANHFHKTDSHYSYMLSGSMEYTEQKVDGQGNFTGKKESAVIGAGDMVYSAPMTAHAMRFLEDSVFIALATESRHQSAYEEDTVRVKLV